MSVESRAPGRQVLRVWHVFGPALILVAVLALFGLLIAARDLAEAREHLDPQGGPAAWSETGFPSLRSFFSWSNGKIVLTQTVIVAVGALGMTLIIVSGGIDLSIGSAIALGSVVGAVLIREQMPLLLVVPATIASGLLVGCVNGALIAGFRMTPFIVTLGMLGVARGLAKWMAGNQTVNFPDPTIGNLMSAESGLPFGVWLAAGLAVCMSLLLGRTVFGRHVFALGSNEATARLCGIRTGWLKWAIYTLSGCFVGLAGLLQMARLRQGDPTAAIGMELDIIAAVVIGGASLSGGTGSVAGSMVGALTMACLRTGSQYMDWPNYTQEIIIGTLIILAVGLDRWRTRRALGRQ